MQGTKSEVSPPPSDSSGGAAHPARPRSTVAAAAPPRTFLVVEMVNGASPGMRPADFAGQTKLSSASPGGPLSRAKVIDLQSSAESPLDQRGRKQALRRRGRR